MPGHRPRRLNQNGYDKTQTIHVITWSQLSAVPHGQAGGIAATHGIVRAHGIAAAHAFAATHNVAATHEIASSRVPGAHGIAGTRNP